MLELYWGCFAVGVLLALATIFLGDLLPADQLPFAHPVSLVGGMTVFGGAGVLLTRYSSLHTAAAALLSLLAAVAVSLAVHFLYVKRMRQMEVSNAFSIRELAGRIGEVSTPIPTRGYGEVVLKAGGAGLTNQIAASFDGEEIPAGAKVVVVEVKDDTLYVSRLDGE
jgi:membrane-bound ClpP family serine protease